MMLIKDYENFDKHKSFEDILKIFTIAQKALFHHNGDMTAVIKANFTKIDSVETIEEVNSKICDYFGILPPDTEIQIYLNRVPDTRNVQIRGGPNKKIVFFLNKTRETFFNTRQKMRTLNHVAITLKNSQRMNTGESFGRIKNVFRAKNTFSYSENYVRDHLKILDGACEKLIKLFVDEKGESHSERLSDTEIVQFLSLLLNHQEDTASQSIDDVFNGDVVFNKAQGNYFYNGRYHAFVTLRKKGAPKSLKDDFTKFLFNEEITDIPFTVQNSIVLKDSEKELENIQNMRSFAESIRPIVGRKKQLQLEREIANFEEIEYICREEKLRILELAWVIHFWAEDPEALEFSRNQFQTLASANGFVLTHEKVNLNCAFQALFPGQFYANKIRFKMISGNSRGLMPVMATPVISKNPKSKNEVLFYNRFGDVVQFDTFDSRCPNWNFLIVGSSGSGKSFFTNQLLFQQMPTTPKIFIVDKGGSYKRLIQNLGGTYFMVDYENQKDFSINFFDGKYSPEKEIFLIAILEQMIVDKSSQYISKAYKAVFQELIRRAYEDTGGNVGNVLDLTTFVEHYLKPNERTRGLTPSLEMYIKDGSYAAFFRKTKISRSLEYACFDLDGLGNNQDLMPIVTLAIVNLIWQSITCDIQRRKIIVIDEAWAALKESSGLSNFIDEIFRTARKHNGTIGLVTQSFQDVLSTSLGAGIKTNTSFFYFLRNKDDPQTLTQVKDITPYIYENKIKDLKFVKGQYSEAYMHSPGLFQDVLRIRPSMPDYWASTTDAGDKDKLLQTQAALEKKREGSVDMVQVIEELCK